jgi:hypothetical protein
MVAKPYMKRSIRMTVLATAQRAGYTGYQLKVMVNGSVRMTGSSERSIFIMNSKISTAGNV